MKTIPLLITLCIAGASMFVVPAEAQVAGTTSVIGISVTELTQVAMGWSVKKSILGKAVYNDAGEKLGTVVDLIIAPDKNLSYLIVGAGGFIGIGRHDVAIPVNQIQDKGGKLVMPGATKDVVKSMPRFEYASSTAKRDQFVASAEQDIAKAKLKAAELEKKVAAAGSDAKAKLGQQLTGLRADLKTAEDKLAVVKQATANRWHDFEGDTNAAMERLRKALTD